MPLRSSETALLGLSELAQAIRRCRHTLLLEVRSSRRRYPEERRDPGYVTRVVRKNLVEQDGSLNSFLAAGDDADEFDAVAFG